MLLGKLRLNVSIYWSPIFPSLYGIKWSHRCIFSTTIFHSKGSSLNCMRVFDVNCFGILDRNSSPFLKQLPLWLKLCSLNIKVDIVLWYLYPNNWLLYGFCSQSCRQKALRMHEIISGREEIHHFSWLLRNLELSLNPLMESFATEYSYNMNSFYSVICVPLREILCSFDR